MKPCLKYISAVLSLIIFVPFCPASQSDAARAVAKRLLGDKAVSNFEFEQIPFENEKDVFEIESAEGKIVFRGSSGVSMASALNWYLKYYCNAHFSWCGNQLAIPEKLPAPEKKIRIASPYKYRHYFNYVTFGYSLPWWDWARWEKEIDWMALNGVNMPLALTGQEAVWQQVFKSYGLTDKEISDFLAGPPYLPFGWLGCFDGWGGPLPQTWIDSHAELQKKILARQRELGMTPVLPGFMGHVPKSLNRVFPDLKIQAVKGIAGNEKNPGWAGFPVTYIIDPNDPFFIKLSRDFLKKQQEMYGTDHLYSADVFNERYPPTNDPNYLSASSKAVFDGMLVADPCAVWVMQGWLFTLEEFWKPEQTKALLDPVPNNRLIILDLNCDFRPFWSKYNSFYGKQWIWCMLHNFGDRPGMLGNLKGMSVEPVAALNNPARGNLAGAGIVPEGIEQNPVMYDMMAEMFWRATSPDINDWLKNYARRRYGRDLPGMHQAWQILASSVYSNTKGFATTAWWMCKRPDWHRYPKAVHYRPADAARAWELMIQNADELKNQDTYQYDLADLTREVLTTLAMDINKAATQAYDSNNLAALTLARDRYLGIIADIDNLLGSRKEFLLANWLEAAKKHGTNDEESKLYEYNARNIITLWGNRESMLADYAYKQWAGLLKDFYYQRWSMYFDALAESLSSNKKPLDAEALLNRLRDFEFAWVHKTNTYPRQPAGDTVEIAKALYSKYKPLTNEYFKLDSKSK